MNKTILITITMLLTVAPTLLGSVIPLKLGDVSGNIIITRRLPDALGWPQPPIELTSSAITVCVRSVGPTTNSLEVTVNYRLNGKSFSKTSGVKNVPVSAERPGCAIEMVKEPSTAGILILESVEVKEQAVTSHQKYTTGQ